MWFNDLNNLQSMITGFGSLAVGIIVWYGLTTLDKHHKRSITSGEGGNQE